MRERCCRKPLRVSLGTRWVLANSARPPPPPFERKMRLERASMMSQRQRWNGSGRHLALWSSHPGHPPLCPGSPCAPWQDGHGLQTLTPPPVPVFRILSYSPFSALSVYLCSGSCSFFGPVLLTFEGFSPPPPPHSLYVLLLFFFWHPGTLGPRQPGFCRQLLLGTALAPKVSPTQASGEQGEATCPPGFGYLAHIKRRLGATPSVPDGGP